ncbi:MAG: hypothetical protein ABFS16_11255 [Bacteroidota bacterium]
MIYTRQDIIKGALIYSSGDTIAALILNDFSWSRLLGIVLIGATVYAFEIPNYFGWIDKKTAEYKGYKLLFYRTSLAILYFNPIWIARHLLFILLASGKFEQVSWNLLRIGLLSFLVNIPISLAANFIIQNKIPLNRRFFASAVFSALMAVYYALSIVFFN